MAVQLCQRCKGNNIQKVGQTYNKREPNGYKYICHDCKKPFKVMFE